MTLHHTEKLIWTALPNGLTPDKRLQVSVFISPRLMPDGSLAAPTLGHFPDFLDWPAVVSAMRFSVRFAGGPTLPAVHAPPAGLHPDPNLWKGLFTRVTPVESHRFNDYSARFIHTFPVRGVMDFVKDQYSQIASNVQIDPETGLQQKPPVQPGPKGSLAAFLNPHLAVPQDDLPRLLANFIGPYRHRKSVPPGAGDTAQHFLQARWFHYAKPIAGSAPPTPPPSSALDFHRIVSAIGEYPAILRLLGLVVDLVVPNAAGIPRDAASTTLQILPSWRPRTNAGESITGVPIQPMTAYTLDASGFHSRSRGKPGDTPIRNGMLNLSDPNTFSLLEVDPDGTMFKIANFASQLARSQASTGSSPPPLAPASAGAPALRSPGIAIIYTGRADNAVLGFGASHDNNDNAEKTGTATLFTEDLLRGYRIDVQDLPQDAPPAPWKSLCSRLGVYSFPTTPAGPKVVKIPDEANVSMAVTTKPDVGADLYLHESLIRWSGWSLAAQRPGKVVGPDGKPTGPATTPTPGLEFAAGFTPLPGSLPRLRYGHRYRIRARMTDLAGNGPTVHTPDDAEAAPPPLQDPLTYRRFEPIEVPAILLRNSIAHSPAEADRHLVVRTDFDKPNPDKYVKYLASVGYPGANPDAQRHIAAPKTSVDMAEQHGMFDLPSGAFDPGAYTNIKGSGIGFAGTLSGKSVNGLDNLDGVFASTAARDSAVYDIDQLHLPYMPDPLALGATFVGLPGSPGPDHVTQQPYGFDTAFGGEWPGLLPFRLQVVGIPAGQIPRSPTPIPSQNGKSAVLRVELPQAEMVTVNLSSYFASDDLFNMGIWGWILDWAVAAKAGESTLQYLQDLATTGRHWMITPFIALTLVHAVQRPLLQPNFTLLTSARTIGDTAARISGILPINGKSTNKVEVHARWTENWDDPARADGPGDTANNPGGPGPLHRTASAFQLPVRPDDTTLQFSNEHHFGDTRYRSVYYSGIATTRFREYFPFTDADLAAGKASITRVGDEVQVDVLSSARPAVPNPLYVLPAFGWSTAPLIGDLAGFSVIRTGRRLRVYMNRPWYSSGDGELLGVVCLPGTTSSALRDRMATALRARAQRLLGRRPLDITEPIETTFKPYITMWGNDPIWGLDSEQALQQPPSVLDFPLAVNRRQGVTVDGLPGVLLDVAGHAVGYDVARKLWYADIQVDAPNAYFPFVRLALARYQPHSVQQSNGSSTEDVFLSRVVMADFAQLAPDRTATVVVDVNNRQHVNVVVTGPNISVSSVTHSVFGGDVPDRSTLMDVTVEEQSPSGTADPGWITVGDPVPLIPSTDRPIASWAASLILPGTPGPRYRLVIKEYEEYYVDSATPGKASIGRRLVYAATLNL